MAEWQGQSDEKDWIGRPDANLIGHALSDAHEAFDAAYYQSGSAAELSDNVTRVVAALNEVLRLTRPAARVLMTEPHDDHPDTVTCPGCPHAYPGSEGDRG